MLYFCVISMLILYLLHLPVKMKIKGGVNFEMGEGDFSFTVLYVPIIRVKGLVERFSLANADFIIQTKKKKTKVHLDIEDISIEKIMEFLRRVDLNFLGNLDVTDVFLRLNYGSGNAFTTTVRLGSVRILFYSLLSALKSNQHVAVEEEFVPDYKTRTIKCDFHGIFSLSVADIIYGFILGKIKRLNRQARKSFKEAV